MNKLSIAALLSIASVNAKSDHPTSLARSAFGNLVEDLKAYQTEAQGQIEFTNKALSEQQAACASEILGFKDDITMFQENYDTALQGQKDREAEVKGLEGELEDYNNKIDAATSEIGNMDAQHESRKTEIETALGKLNSAHTDMSAVHDQVSTGTGLASGLTSSSKNSLEEVIANVRGKMLHDKEKLTGDLANLIQFHEDNRVVRLQQRAKLEELKGSTQASIKGANAALRAQTVSKNTATSELNNSQSLLHGKERQCAQEIQTLNESVADSTTRAEALGTAIEILGQSKVKSLLQTAAKVSENRTSNVISTPTAFLQIRKQPTMSKQMLLSQISSLSKSNSKITNLLRIAFASPKKAEAFITINKELKKLLNTMHNQNLADDKAQSWCHTQQDDLSRQIQETGDEFNELNTAIEGLENKVTAYTGKLKENESKIQEVKSQRSKDKAENKKEIVNKEADIRELTDGHKKLYAAYRALEDAFSADKLAGDKVEEVGGQGVSAGAADVLKTVNGLIEEFEDALSHADREVVVFKKNGAAAEKLAEQHLNTTRDTKKTNEIFLQEHSESANSKNMQAYDVQGALKQLQTTFDLVFTEKDGKCFQYDTTYPARKADRNVEMDNVKEAQAAIKTYTESIGLTTE